MLFQMVLVASLGSHRKVLNDLCTHHREVRLSFAFVQKLRSVRFRVPVTLLTQVTA